MLGHDPLAWIKNSEASPSDEAKVEVPVETASKIDLDEEGVSIGGDSSIEQIESIDSEFKVERSAGVVSDLWKMRDQISEVNEDQDSDAIEVAPEAELELDSSSETEINVDIETADDNLVDDEIGASMNQDNSGETLVDLGSTLNITVASSMHNKLLEVLQQLTEEKVVVDGANIEAIDTAGLQLLVAFISNLKQRKVQYDLIKSETMLIAINRLALESCL